MSKIMYQIEKTYHHVPLKDLPNLRQTMEEDYFSYCPMMEDVTYQSEEEARAEFVTEYSSAVVADDELQVTVISLCSGEGEIDREMSEEYGEEIYYIPEETTVDCRPFDDASAALLHAHDVNEDWLLQ